MVRNQARLPHISPVFYYLCLLLAFVLTKLVFRLSTTRDPALKTVKGGLLIVANHQSYADPLLIATAFPRRPIHFVAGRYLFAGKMRRRLLGWLGVIAKEQMRPDASTVRDLIRLARAGRTLFIFPEGQRAVDGRTNPIPAATGRLIKKLGLPVAAVRLSGVYLSWPRWAAHGLRPGKVSQEATLLLTRDEIAALTVEDINARLAAALSVDEYDAQLARRRPRTYRGKNRAEGLDAVLHWCPVCAQPFQLRASGTALGCTVCGLQAEMAASGLLTPDAAQALPASPAEWHERQRAAWHRHVAAHGFSFEASIYETMDRSGKAPRRAVLTLGENGYAVVFADGRRVFVPADDNRALFADYGRYFRLHAGTEPLYIWPDNGQAVIACLDLLLTGYMRPASRDRFSSDA